MLTGNEFYVVVKLISGEQMMAVLQMEDEEHIVLDHPMVMRLIPVLETGKEHITAHPLCAFTDETEFVISKNNIVFIKKLHHVFVSHYQKIVEQHEKLTSFVPANSAESLDWGDEITPEEARKASKMLQDILEEEEEIDWDEKIRNLVPGNDTLN